MKKNIVLLTILLISCAPQVTVTSEVTVTSTPPPAETPIPTPTFHPQYIALQESIAASGGRFTLQADGTIQDGAEIVPDITVSLDGVMTITVDGETVTLDPADVTFGDESGISIKDYELNDDGEWVGVLSGEILAAQDVFDNFGYDYSDLYFSENEEDKVVATDEEGKVVFEDGEFAFNFAVEQAAQLDLMPTNIKYKENVLKGAGMYVTEDSNLAFEYFGPLYTRVRAQFIQTYGFDPYKKGETVVEDVMLNPEILAWGRRMLLNHLNPTTDTYLYYELEDGKIKIVPLL